MGERFDAWYNFNFKFKLVANSTPNLGVGQFTSVEGDVYRGLWQRGQRHGWGIESYVDGGKFIGAWRLNKRHGCGVFNWPDGAHTLREYRQDELVTGEIIFIIYNSGQRLIVVDTRTSYFCGRHETCFGEDSNEHIRAANRRYYSSHS